jgi:hypothetical protein
MSLIKEKIELELEEAELNTQAALSQFPPIARWLIIVLVLGTIPAYFIAKSVTYHATLSRLQSQIPQSKTSFTNPEPPIVSNITATTLGTNTYSAVAQIKNPNLDLSAENVPYTFHFYNSQKQELKSVSDTFYILPNESKYISAPRVTTSEPIASIEFQLPQTFPWQKRLQIPTVKLTTSAPVFSYQTSPQALVVDGDFVNNSPYSLKEVRITFVLFDSNNKIIGSSQRDEFTIAPFERRTYKQLWPNVVAPGLTTVNVEASTDTLDPNNITAPPSGSSSSDLSRPASPGGFQ